MSFAPTGPTDVHRVTAPVPPPESIDTTFVGRLEFHNGYPAESTVQRLYDQLDFERGCEVFLRHLMSAAVWGFQRGFQRDLGIGANELAMFHLDANGLLLTGNSETIYGISMLDLNVSGPLVVDVPPRVLGLANDMWMRPQGDLGIAGPDHGAGGRYLFLPPDHDGDQPDGEFAGVIHSRTYRVWLVIRAFMGADGTPAAGFATLEQTGIYPLAEAANLPPTVHHDISGRPFDTIHPTDIRYFDDLAEIIDYEQVEAISAEERAQLAQIGIQKGIPFAPDERMRSILGEAALVGSHMAFAIANAPRDEYRRTPERNWFGHVPGYPTFENEHGDPLIDYMVRMAWFGTGRTLAMHATQPGLGSAYTWEYSDANGDWIDAARTYRLHLPGPIPAKEFWSVVVYDLWTRSMLANGQAHPSLSTYSPGVVTNDDGSVDVYIGPEPPPGKATNWIRTLPDTGWFPMLRLYGPLEPWIDGTWQPDDLEPLT